MNRFTLALIVAALLGGVAASGLFDFIPAWSATQSKAGCTADPWGCPAQTTIDAGCTADPDGCPPSQPTTDEGCTADPNGNCRPGS
jgi:hypothetical protein